MKSPVVQVATVLAAMHRLGFAHLDVKPSNVLAAAKQPRTYRLADYGLAARLDGAFPIEEGDRAYISAELLAGEHGQLAAADVFALGVTLYELASGVELPHEGDQYAALRRGHVPPLSGCCGALASVIEVCAMLASCKQPMVLGALLVLQTLLLFVKPALELHWMSCLMSRLLDVGHDAS
jgi:serine/threonine protein kinase